MLRQLAILTELCAYAANDPNIVVWKIEKLDDQTIVFRVYETDTDAFVLVDFNCTKEELMCRLASLNAARDEAREYRLTQS